MFDYCGDISGQSPLYVTSSGEHSNSIVEVKNKNPSAFSRKNISSTAVEHILQNGFVPLPSTVFSNLFVLGQGDGFSSGNSFRYNFYYKNANSTGNSVPDTKKLLSVLIKSLNSIEKPKGRVFLMLSSGKDSVAIAIALSMSNLKDSTTCLTFTNDKPNEESVIASEICNRLGLRHKAVSIDINNKSFSDTLRKGISNFTLPSLDLVTIPYLKCVLENVGKGDLLLDGSGNDVYVGHVPPKWQKQWDTFINRTEYLGRYARNVVHPRTKLAKLFRTRSEFCFAGKYLSFQEAKKIYKETNDVRGYWRDSDKNYNNMDLFDFRAVIRGRHPDQELFMRKVRACAEAVGAEVYFPWCHKAVIDYYFNLPETYRFDRNKLMNKLLLRQMLKNEIDYDAGKIGKRGFEFEAEQFFITIKYWVFDEVTNCGLWSVKEVSKLLNILYKEKKARYPYDAINVLHLFSAWHNNAKILV